MNYQDTITLKLGKPCIRGMRITVYDILACLSYAADREQKPLTISA